MFIVLVSIFLGVFFFFLLSSSLILPTKANCNTDQKRVSSLSCRDGDSDELERLLSSGKYGVYDEDSFYGWTPAHWAAYFDKLDCLMKVLRFHCNNGNHATYTVTNQSVDLATKRFGQTPLHVAAFAGNILCVKWLLHCGASKDKQDYIGETSLHKAVRTGSLECTKMLTSHAASCAIRNKNGQIPKDLARACGYLLIADYLRQAEELSTLPKPFSTSEAAMEDDAMEASNEEPARPEPTPEKDVLLDGAVAANAVSIGGRKRPRQSDDESAIKRIRHNPLTAADFSPPNLSGLFKEPMAPCQPNGTSNGLSTIPAFGTSPAVTIESHDLPNPSHFKGRPLFYSPAINSGSRPIDADADGSSAMEGDEMMEDAAEGTKPRSSASCPRLYDRYPGSLEFGHGGVATANSLAAGPRDDSAATRKTHCFLSSSNHYNNNSPIHRNRSTSSSSGSTASSGWTEHCSSVLQEQDYCANYSQLMGDEMFQNIHGC